MHLRHRHLPACLFVAGHMIEVILEFVDGCWWSVQYVDGVETSCVVSLPPREGQSLRMMMTARGWEDSTAVDMSELDFDGALMRGVVR